MGRAGRFASGKASRAGKARSKERIDPVDEGTADDHDAHMDDSEPHCAQSARAKSRGEPTRQSSGGKRQRAPSPRGPPAAKPKKVLRQSCRWRSCRSDESATNNT